VDFADDSIDAETLAARSRVEAETSKILDEIENEEGHQKLNKKDKKKKLKSENKGNFSSYRNKSFVKNASRPTKDLSSDGEEVHEDNSDVESADDSRLQSKSKKKLLIVHSSSSRAVMRTHRTCSLL
jgi:hypothetical protein